MHKIAESVDIGPCPACNFDASGTRDVSHALGYVDVCVNCLHPRIIANPSPPDVIPAPESTGVLLVSLRGMTWRASSCPYCEKPHAIPCGLDSPRKMLGHRVEAPCGNSPLLLVEVDTDSPAGDPS